jgi:hypothetical protein
VTATLIDGKALGARVREEVAESVAELGHVGLATVLSATTLPRTSTST